ncbi:hypothetical protein M2159_008540 [Streptomyces sp. SAI-090]|nr:hypothetical protein [Streptomyces sp. SAI-090]
MRWRLPGAWRIRSFTPHLRTAQLTADCRRTGTITSTVRIAGSGRQALRTSGGRPPDEGVVAGAAGEVVHDVGCGRRGDLPDGVPGNGCGAGGVRHPRRGGGRAAAVRGRRPCPPRRMISVDRWPQRCGPWSGWAGRLLGQRSRLLLAIGATTACDHWRRTPTGIPGGCSFNDAPRPDRHRALAWPGHAQTNRRRWPHILAAGRLPASIEVHGSPAPIVRVGRVTRSMDMPGVPAPRRHRARDRTSHVSHETREELKEADHSATGRPLGSPRTRMRNKPLAWGIPPSCASKWKPPMASMRGIRGSWG